MQSLDMDLVYTARILALNGLGSGPFGNVSARIPGTSEYLINPTGILFEQVTPQDLVRETIDHSPQTHEGGTHPGDCIHKEIYRQRPDVSAIVHTHSHHTVMLSVLGKPIEPYTQVGAAFFEDQGIYEGFHGPVREYEEGAAIARALARHSIVIAVRHGIFAAGKTLSAALWDMMLADWAAREQLHAIQLGMKSAPFLPPEICAKSRREVRGGMHAANWQSQLRRLRAVSPELF